MSGLRSSTNAYPDADSWPFVLAPSYSRVVHQRVYQNIPPPGFQSETFGNRPVKSDIHVFGINKTVQTLPNQPLPTPYDTAPGQAVCEGPVRVDETDFCVTNVVVTKSDSCFSLEMDPRPVCNPGYEATSIGCGYYSNPEERSHYILWQCLPATRHE